MEQLRERYDSYREARERELLRVHAGYAETPALDEIDDRFGDLTAGEPLEALRAQRDARRLAGEREADDRLIALVEDAVLAARSWRLGRELRASGAHLEPRAADELREERFALLGDARRKLGYEHGRARCAARHPEVDVDAWARGAARLLEATEPAYRDRIGSLLARARADPEPARPEDLLQMLRKSGSDRFFDAARRLACLDHLTAGLGLALERSPGVSLDCEPRAGRAAAAQSFYPRLPGEIVVSAAPAGGVAAYADFFAAAGRAHAAAHVSSELPVERRRGLDPACAHGWGWLLSERLDDPAWIASGPGQARADEAGHEASLRRLFTLRELAGRLCFEQILSLVPGGDDPHRLADRWAELCAGALGVPATPDGYLAACDAELPSLHELRGRAFALQLAEWLRERYGRTFWKERRAGALLQELWHTGSTYSAEAVAAELGFAPLDPEHLIGGALRLA